MFNSLAGYLQTDKFCQNRLFENVDVRNNFNPLKLLLDVDNIEIYLNTTTGKTE